MGIRTSRELVIHDHKLVGELVVRCYELVVIRCELVVRCYKLIVISYELVVRSYELVISDKDLVVDYIS